MSRQIDRLIGELVDYNMLIVKKMKKSELFELVKVLMTDNLRELHDESIIEMYEEQFDTHLARY